MKTDLRAVKALQDFWAECNAQLITELPDITDKQSWQNFIELWKTLKDKLVSILATCTDNVKGMDATLKVLDVFSKMGSVCNTVFVAKIAGELDSMKTRLGASDDGHLEEFNAAMTRAIKHAESAVTMGYEPIFCINVKDLQSDPAAQRSQRRVSFLRCAHTGYMILRKGGFQSDSSEVVAVARALLELEPEVIVHWFGTAVPEEAIFNGSAEGWISKLLFVLCNDIKAGFLTELESKVKVSGAHKIVEFMIEGVSTPASSLML